MTLFKPIPLPPAFGIFCDGVFRQHGPLVSLTQGGFCVICAHNALMGVTISLVHRYFIFPNKWQIFFRSKWIIIIYFLEHVGLASVVVGCLVWYGTVDSAEIRKTALEVDETLSYFFDEPSFVVVNPDTVKPYLILGLMGIYGVVLFAVVIGFFFVRRLRLLNMKENSFHSFKITKMLFVSNVVQFIVTVIYLIFPFTVFFLLHIFDLPYSGQMIMVALTFCSFHCTLEFITSIYFVSPYKAYIKKCWAEE